jgi:hypothetical protein
MALVDPQELERKGELPPEKRFPTPTAVVNTQKTIDQWHRISP